jgi:hypothetical protein
MRESRSIQQQEQQTDWIVTNITIRLIQSTAALPSITDTHSHQASADGKEARKEEGTVIKLDCYTLCEDIGD